MAEKLEAMLHLGALNSRMKDFYDIWRLAQQSFDGGVLFGAVRRTLENRNTEAVQFAVLEKELNEAGDKQTQWTAFLRKSMVSAPTAFVETLGEIGILIAPVLGAIVRQNEFAGTWRLGGPWQLTT